MRLSVWNPFTHLPMASRLLGIRADDFGSANDCVTLAIVKSRMPPICPHAWHVIFQTEDGKRYAATQTYFVTEECWRGIKRYLARRLMREPKGK